MPRVTCIEMTVTLSNGEEATATINSDGNIFRGGSYNAMCEIVEPTEAMRAALFDGSHMADETDTCEHEFEEDEDSIQTCRKCGIEDDE